MADDARTRAHALIDVGHRALGESGDRATRIQAAVLARWLHALVRAASSAPELPAVAPDPPEGLARRAEAARALLGKDDEFHRRDAQGRRAGLSSREAATRARAPEAAQ